MDMVDGEYKRHLAGQAGYVYDLLNSTAYHLQGKKKKPFKYKHNQKLQKIAKHALTCVLRERYEWYEMMRGELGCKKIFVLICK